MKDLFLHTIPEIIGWIAIALFIIGVGTFIISNILEKDDEYDEDDEPATEEDGFIPTHKIKWDKN